MSKLDNPIMEGSSGRLGKSVVYRTVRGKVVMSKRPKRGRKFNEEQTGVQRKFLRASRYAKLQIDNSSSRELYEKGISDKKPSAYTVAMSDFLNAPVVESIGAFNYLGEIGDTLRIEASDDFRVTEVKVIISDPQGTRLESGDATADPMGTWLYKVTHQNPLVAGTKIRAIAFDRPGNTGQLEIVL